jgi:hypothetical protein
MPLWSMSSTARYSSYAWLSRAELGGAIGQRATEPDHALVIERHDSDVEDLGRRNRRLAVREFGNSHLDVVSM